MLWWARSPATRWAVNWLPAPVRRRWRARIAAICLSGYCSASWRTSATVSWSVQRVWLPVRGRLTVCSVVAPPSHTTRSSAACCSDGAVDGHDDVGEDRAKQLLALAVAGGRRIEHLAQVSACSPAPRDLLLGERVRALGGVSAMARSARRTSVSRCSHSRSSVRATSRFSGSQASNWRRARSAWICARSSSSSAERTRAWWSELGVLDRAQRRLDPGRAQRLEHGVEHDPLDPPAADGLAALGAVQLVAAHARVVGHERLAAVADLHLPPAAPAADQSLQQRPALARGAAALPARRAPVRAQPLLVGEVALEGDVAGVVAFDAHVPLLARRAALPLADHAVSTRRSVCLRPYAYAPANTGLVRISWIALYVGRRPTAPADRRWPCAAACGPPRAAAASPAWRSAS